MSRPHSKESNLTHQTLRTIVAATVLLFSCISATAAPTAFRKKKVSKTLPEQPLQTDYQQALALIKHPSAQLYKAKGKHFAVLPGPYILLVTREYAIIKGYRGPTNLGIIIDPTGTVRHVVIIHTTDTTKYMKKVKKKLKMLSGQTLATEERPVLAVTRATKSAKAITKTVNETLQTFAAIFPNLVLDNDTVSFNNAPLPPIATITPPPPPKH